MLGLRSTDVRLEKSDPAWPAAYTRETERIRNVLGELAAHIEHIGSTSVPGLDAKPVLDIAIATHALDRDLTRIETAMTAAGYTSKGEFGLPGRRFFTRGDPVTVHLHIVQTASPHWTAWIKFRDALRNDPALRQRYLQLKQNLATQHASDRAAYTAAKTEFIAAVLAAHRD